MRGVSVTPASPAVGAFVDGVDIAQGVTDAQLAVMRQAFVDHGVIFLRGQHITPEQQLAFAQRWGEIKINRFFTTVNGHPEISEIRKEPDHERNIGDRWHTDHSFDVEPAMASMLWANEVPAAGGDTMFASQYAAYDALSDGMKATLGGMRSRHSTWRVAVVAEHQKDRFDNADGSVEEAVHPVIIKHPLSGRPALYVNASFTYAFEGWTREESERLLDQLYSHASRPEFTYRFQWEPGSMAIWDNRAVQHFAINDYPGQRRVMHRIVLQGSRIDPFFDH